MEVGATLRTVAKGAIGRGKLAAKIQPAMDSTDLNAARSLARFIDASPSPYHAVQEAVRLLTQHDFEPLDERSSWNLTGGRYFAIRGGSLIAFVIPAGAPTNLGFRIVGAHTDSPNLRIKPQPDTGGGGLAQFGVEVYGGALLNSWLDRDLGLSGRVYLRNGDTEISEEHLFHIDRPLLRVPQLAIHLNREIHEEGLRLNPQLHMSPIVGSLDASPGFHEMLAQELGIDSDRILSFDAMCHDLQPACICGWQDEFLSAGRLDNLCSSYCGLVGMLDRLERGEKLVHLPVLALFDHEEVGSASNRGAGSPLLGDLLERTILARGGTREDFHCARANSACVSADMAHATHPNYADKHEPEHWLEMNRGPVIKINSNLRYATDGGTEALFQQACERADVPFQKWVNRTDLACGSTIGPITAARTGIPTVDVGTAQLAMHSAREICGSHDPAFLVRALSAFFE